MPPAVQALVSCVAFALPWSVLSAPRTAVPANGFINDLDCRSHGRVLMEFAQGSTQSEGEEISFLTLGPSIGGTHCFGDWALRLKLGSFGLTGADAFSVLLLGTEFGWSGAFGGSFFVPWGNDQVLSLFVDARTERGRAFDPFVAAENGITTPSEIRASKFMRSFSTLTWTSGIRVSWTPTAHALAFGFEGAFEHALSRDDSNSDLFRLTTLLSTHLGALSLPGVAPIAFINANLPLVNATQTYELGLGIYDVARPAFTYGLEAFRIFNSSSSSYSIRGSLNFFY